MRSVRDAAERGRACVTPRGFWFSAASTQRLLAWSCPDVLHAALRLALDPRAVDRGEAAAFARARDPPPPALIRQNLEALAAEALGHGADVGAPTTSEWRPSQMNLLGLQLQDLERVVYRLFTDEESPRWTNVVEVCLPRVTLSPDLQRRICGRPLVRLAVATDLRWTSSRHLRPVLRRLSLSLTTLEDSELTAIGALPALELLHLQQCHLRPRQVSLGALAAAPQLASLRLQACRGVAGASFACAWPALTELFVTEALSVNRDLYACLRGCPQLRVLRLDRCLNLAGAGVAVLGVACPQLESLSLDGTLLQPSQLPELHALRNLRELSLVSTFVTHAQVRQVLRGHVSLRVIYFTALDSAGAARGGDDVPPLWEARVTVPRPCLLAPIGGTTRARQPVARPALGASTFEPVD